MAERKVKVALELDARDYVRGTGSADKATEKLGDTIAGTGERAKKMGDDVDRAAKAAGEDLDEVARHAKRLDDQIKQTEGGIRSLARAFANTGDPQFFRQIREQQRVLGNLRNVRKMLPDPAEVVAEGGKLGARLAAGVQGVLPPQMTMILAGVGVAAAPLLGAAVSGAIIGGAGVGGVLGGLVLASKDPRVAAAAKATGTRLMANLGSDAGAFVQPAIDGLRQIEHAVNEVHLDRIFRDAAQLVDPLARSVSALIVDLGVALEQLIANADGPIDAIADGVEMIGKALAQGLTMLADNGVEAEAALRILFAMIASSVSTVMVSVNALTELYGIINKLGLDTGLKLLLAATTMGQRDLGEETQATTSKFRYFSGEVETAEKRLQSLGGAQKVGTEMMDQLLASTGAVTTKMLAQKQAADLLRSAHEQMTSAAIGATEANEGYEAAWDDLTDSVKENGRTLNIHTVAGRANRDSLQNLLTKNNELYFANIQNGMSIAEATKKHQSRTSAIRKEAIETTGNKKAVDNLIGTYGRVPSSKTTNLFVQGFTQIEKVLLELYAYQRSLHNGQSLAVTRAQVRSELHGGFAGDPRAFRRAQGGPIPGYSPSDTADNIPAMLTADEWVIRRPAARKMERQNPGALAHINRHGELPAYAAGGHVLSRKEWGNQLRYGVNVRGTRIPSRAEVASKVIPAVPGGVTGPWMERLLERRFGVGMISGYRPGSRTLSGNQSYHALNRAVDFPPVRAMAKFMYDNYKRSLREAITPYPEYNVHNGRDHRYTGAVWQQHNFAGGNAHNHFAMKNGGLIREPVVGIGRSGATYSFAEDGRTERVLSAGQTAAGGGGGNVYITNHITVPVGAHPAEVGRAVTVAQQAYFERGGRLVVHGKPVLP